MKIYVVYAVAQGKDINNLFCVKKTFEEAMQVIEDEFRAFVVAQAYKPGETYVPRVPLYFRIEEETLE